MTLGKLFTYWGVLGHTFDTEILYSCVASKDHSSMGVEENRLKPQKYVKHAKVHAKSIPTCVAHIIYRSKVDGTVGAMLQADIYFNAAGSGTEFIPNATLGQLEQYIT